MLYAEICPSDIPQLLWEWNHDMATAEGWLYGMLPTNDLVKGQKHPVDPVYKGATQ